MKHTFSKKLMFLSIIVVFVLACEIPGLSAPAPSIVDSVPIETIIAGTAAAAQTQTVAALPAHTENPLATFTTTPTLVPTITTTPTETLFVSETPSPTATVIFIIVIPTSTPIFVASSAGDNCELISVTPYQPTLNPSESFNITWKVKNTGSGIWIDDVDFQYVSGTDMHKKDLYDLPSKVPPRGDVSFTVAMVAPKKSGRYTTNWVLGSQKKPVCAVSATVIVR